MNKLILKISLALFIVLAVGIFLAPEKTSAFALNPSPSAGSDDIPPSLRAQLESCNSQPFPYAFSPVFWQWLSPQADGSTDRMRVASGTTAVTLRMHFASTSCRSPNTVPESRIQTANASVVSGGGSVSGAVGQTLALSNGNPQGAYSSDGFDFTYSDPAGFTSNRTVLIQFTNKSINRFRNGSYTCIAVPRPSAGGGWNFGLCPDEVINFTLFIEVTPAVVRGCTDPLAINYNPAANVNDGSCVYTPPASIIECPSYPPFASFNDPNVVVAMPDQGKPDNVYSDPVPGAESSSVADAGISGDSLSQTESRIITYVQQGSRDAFYAVYISNQGVDKTRVVSVLDKLWATETTDYNAATSGDGTIELDYTSHSVNYPYDTHQPRVTFQVQYENRQLIQDSSRTRTIIETRTQSRAVDTDPWGAWSNWGVASDTGYGGWGGWGNRPNNMQRLGYAWTTNFTADAVVMPPCWPRDFTANPVANNASLAPDQEDPTSSNFSFDIPVEFNVSHGGSLRTASLVKDLEYTVEYNSEGYTGGSLGGSFSGRTTINAAGPTVPSNGRFSGTRNVGVSIPANLKAGDRVCWTIRVDKPKGTVKVSSGDIYTSSGPASSQRACSDVAVDIPYTRFYGADVYAGGGFAVPGETCSATAVADATGWMKGSSVGDFRGTGAQLALFAVGQIRSVQAIAQQTDRDPTQLSFANTVTNSALREFGGGFGSAICANDYFADLPVTTPLNPSIVDVSTLASGRYLSDTGGPINLSGLVPDGRRIVIYVDGDAVINGSHFGYANNSSWPTTDDIPSLYIIARGNVYIDDAVSVLDGVYIAQPEDDGTEGEIYTCTLNDGVNNLDLTVNNPYSIKALTIPCRTTQLRIYGAFVAKRVNLLRTLGSLRESVVSEGPDPSRSAEIFQYSPEMYLTGGGGLPSTTRIQIDSYVSLPPSL